VARRTYITARNGEDIAVRYLEQKKYEILCRNYRFGHGEIDIIANDNGIIVFVEVKTRKSLNFGKPEDSVTPKKRDQLRKIAEGYLFEHNIEDSECRFDVIAIEIKNHNYAICHFENAF